MLMVVRRHLILRSRPILSKVSEGKSEIDKRISFSSHTMDYGIFEKTKWLIYIVHLSFIPMNINWNFQDGHLVSEIKGTEVFFSVTI